MNFNQSFGCLEAVQNAQQHLCNPTKLTTRSSFDATQLLIWFVLVHRAWSIVATVVGDTTVSTMKIFVWKM